MDSGGKLKMSPHQRLLQAVAKFNAEIAERQQQQQAENSLEGSFDQAQHDILLSGSNMKVAEHVQNVQQCQEETKKLLQERIAQTCLQTEADGHFVDHEDHLCCKHEQVVLKRSSCLQDALKGDCLQDALKRSQLICRMA